MQVVYYMATVYVGVLPDQILWLVFRISKQAERLNKGSCLVSPLNIHPYGFSLISHLKHKQFSICIRSPYDLQYCLNMIWFAFKTHHNLSKASVEVPESETYSTDLLLSREIFPSCVDFPDRTRSQVWCVYPALDRVQIQLVVSVSRSLGVWCVSHLKDRVDELARGCDRGNPWQWERQK